MLYNNLSGYLKKKYGAPVKKICIDGGFTCPNRDGRISFGGCIFCSERGSGEHIRQGLSIGEQVRSAIRNGTTEKYIAYFQNFTNTYADTETLKRRYDEALISEKIVALAIGTRPDCIDEEIADLIASYRDRLDVWVELGLQTASDEVARKINRGYDTGVFERAFGILQERGIPVVVHLIVGLPTEDIAAVKRTADYIAKFPIFGIKIHSLYVATKTPLAALYEDGEYYPITLEFYTEAVCYILSHISPEVVVHRLTGDCPKDRLVAPSWILNKNEVLSAIRNKLAEGELYQGIYYEK